MAVAVSVTHEAAEVTIVDEQYNGKSVFVLHITAEYVTQAHCHNSIKPGAHERIGRATPANEAIGRVITVARTRVDQAHPSLVKILTYSCAPGLPSAGVLEWN